MFFSVIVPVYKAESYLEICVKSILSQSFCDFELILINDGSPDNSLSICNRFAAEDKRVRVIDKKNGGAASARIVGANEALGDYIVAVDSDDWIEPKLLEDLYCTITKENCDIVLYNAIAFDETVNFPFVHMIEPGIYSGKSLDLIRSSFMWDASKENINFGTVLFSLWSKTIRRDLFQKYQQPVPKSIIKGDDLAVFAPILYQCDSLAVIEGQYYHYRMNPKSIMHRYSEKDVISCVNLYDYLLEYCGTKYRENLNICIVNMVLEHICGIAKTSGSYAEFKEKVSLVLNSRLKKPIDEIDIKRIRLLDKIMIMSLRNKAYFLYFYYGCMKG